MYWMDGPGDAKLPPPISKIQNPIDGPVQRKRVAQWTISGNGTTKYYVFGGFTYNERYLNDFWMYEYKQSDEKNGTWTFLGEKPANYGIKGVPSPTNWPTKRESSITFMDTNFNFYLLSGNGFDMNGNQGQLSDLWKFDGQNWIWINGEQNLNLPAIMKDQGQPNPENRYIKLKIIV